MDINVIDNIELKDLKVILENIKREFASEMEYNQKQSSKNDKRISLK